MLVYMANFQYYFILLLAFLVTLAAGDGYKREKVIIHVPIKFRTIHHHKIEKIPIHIKKHVHHHHKYKDVHKHHLDDDGDSGPYARFDGGHFDSYENSDEYYY